MSHLTEKIDLIKERDSAICKSIELNLEIKDLRKSLKRTESRIKRAENELEHMKIALNEFVINKHMIPDCLSDTVNQAELLLHNH